MTTVDVVFRFGAVPSEGAVLAMARLREVYGVRKVELAEAEKTVRVEYDSTRLTEAVIHQLLRRAGLDLVGKVALVADPPKKEEAPAA